MTESLAELAVRALSHDPDSSLAGVAAHVAAHGPSARATAVLGFVQVLSCDFDGALISLPEADDPLSKAMAAFISAACLARVPEDEDVAVPDECDRGLHAFVVVEAAMSAGQIARAEELALRFAPSLAPIASGTFWAWNQVALARSLAFQGRFTEARAAIDLVLVDPRAGDWPAVDRIARGVQAFVAAHAGDATFAERFVAGLETEVPEPRTYMEAAAYVLAAFAEQAAGRLGQLDQLVLLGGGGRFLPRFQVVDRIYAYEMLVESALSRGELPVAGDWLDLAEAHPVTEHGMASAAVARCRARIALAHDDPETGARESVISAERALLVGGALEVLRAQLLQAAATRAQGTDDVDVAGLEAVALRAANTGARVLRAWAGRELALRGRHLRNAPGIGWEALTDRQRLVALLAAQGLRNREIGGRLFLSERTVEGHIAAVLDALGAPSRVGIGAYVPMTSTPVPLPSLGLTPRQRSVAALVADGSSNSAIAAALGISEKTVEKHVSDLFVRLQVQSRAAVAALVRNAS
ncbi:MAG: LuxR family transcriptional regulator [Marmoricola sp.]|nr:LuxR family transcriptional regulator [Marmoricola sp.]